MTNSLMDEENSDLLLVTFRLEDAWYGLDTNRIQEVIQVGGITVVQHAPDYVRGIANLRGKIVTVIDLALKLGLEQRELSADTRILIVNWIHEQVGLVVEWVGEVVSLNQEQIESVPTNIDETLGHFLKGVYYKADEDRLLGILDLDAVLIVADKEST